MYKIPSRPFSPLHAHTPWQGFDKYGEVCLFDLNSTNTLEEEQTIFVETFLEVYKEYSPEMLGIATSKKEFLEDSFKHFQEDFSKGTVKIITVRQQGVLLGFAGFQTTEIPHQIYISRIAIHPSYWNRGLGRQLVFSILKELPETNHLVVITREINEMARKFYKALGFTENSYLHEGYSPKEYTSYELKISK